MPCRPGPPRYPGLAAPGHRAVNVVIATASLAVSIRLTPSSVAAQIAPSGPTARLKTILLANPSSQVSRSAQHGLCSRLVGVCAC
jgi:hypothetical protein